MGLFVGVLFPAYFGLISPRGADVVQLEHNFNSIRDDRGGEVCQSDLGITKVQSTSGKTAGGWPRSPSRVKP